MGGGGEGERYAGVVQGGAEGPEDGAEGGGLGGGDVRGWVLILD